MDTTNTISLLSAVVAFISLLLGCYYANDARKSAERANRFSSGMLENDVRRLIIEAKTRFEDLATELENLLNGRSVDELSDAEKKLFNQKKLRFQSRIEEVLNSYEQACGKYIDEKIDKNRFRKDYTSEVQRIFSDKKSFYDLLHPQGTSKFKALWKVYEEWFNLEK